MVRFWVQPFRKQVCDEFMKYWRKFLIDINLSPLIQQHFAHKDLTCTVIWIYWLAFCLYWHLSLPADLSSDLSFIFSMLLFLSTGANVRKSRWAISVLFYWQTNMGNTLPDTIHRVHYTGILSTVSDSQQYHSHLCLTIVQPQMGKFIFIPFILLSTTSLC